MIVRFLNLTSSTSRAAPVPGSEATDPDGGEEAVGGDATDLGETAALGDETGGEAADLGDASRGGEDAGFAGVAACAVESAMVSNVLEF